VLKVGVIGAGQVAIRHAAAYAANRDAVVVAVADTDADRAGELARQHRAEAYRSYEDLFAAGGVDAVSVCVPHHLHLPVTSAATEAGVHLLMEKPIANTLAEADEMIVAAERAGVTMMIGFVHRFRTEVLEAKRLLDEGAVGAPATAIDKFCSLGGSHPPAWVWRKAEAGGGVLMYGGIHALDRLLWFLESDVVSVYCRTHNYAGYGDVEDGLVAMLEFANGTTGVLFENSPPYGRPGGWSTEIFGPDGAVRVLTGEAVELTSSRRSFALRSADELHFEREIDEFVSAVLERREPSVPAAAGRAALDVALAIYESARRAEPVNLADRAPFVAGGVA
jgi:predicted dehydrogenase